MNLQQIKGTDIYNFPETSDIKQSLYWMGENYLEYILEGFTEQFQKQDSKTQIIGIKLEADPEFSYKVSSKDGKFHAVNVSFNLQFLLLDGDDRNWRLRGIAKYAANELHTEDPKITLDFELQQSEQV